MPSGKKRGSKTSFLPDQEPWAGVEVFARVEEEERTCHGGLVHFPSAEGEEDPAFL